MKRIMCAVAALGLLVVACGSGDEPASANDPAEPLANSTEQAPANEESTADESTADEPAADEPNDDNGADDADETGNDDAEDLSNAGPIRSISDVPEVCREGMTRFLRSIEPIVSSIDWQTATLADFETIAAEFEAQADDFETSSASIGCDDLDFVDDNETELLVEFAKDEAPGAVGFLEFISLLNPTGSSGDAGGSTDGDDVLESCDDATAFVQSLMADYDSFQQVPAAELVKFTQITALFMTCTPEQLEYFESDEFTAFFDE